MILKDIERQPLEGALNVNTFAVDNDGGIFLRRNPKNNSYVWGFISHEQDFIGFKDFGGTFRRRTPHEQSSFTLSAARHGLRVLPPSYVDERGRNYYQFIQGVQNLDEFLPEASDEETGTLVYDLFHDLRRAHTHGFVYGDRWSQNILITPSNGLLHIDFDIEISGPTARELEVASVAFYTLCAGRERVIPLLSTVLSRKDIWFEPRVVEHFMMRLATHFQRHPQYGNAIDDTANLIDVTRALRATIM